MNLFYKKIFLKAIKKYGLCVPLGFFILLPLGVKSQCNGGAPQLPCSGVGNITTGINNCDISQVKCFADSIHVKSTSSAIGGASIDSISFCCSVATPAVQNYNFNYSGCVDFKLNLNPDSCACPNGYGEAKVFIEVYQNCNGVMQLVGKDDYTFFVYFKPRAEFSSSPNDTLCLDKQPFTFNPSCSCAPLGTTYFWNFGDTQTLADSSHATNPLYTYINSQTGTFNVVCTATNQCGTLSYNRNVVVLLPPNPKIVSTDLSICSGSSTILTVSPTQAFVSYLWSGGSTNDSITVNTANTFTVTVTDAYGCTESTDTATIINPLPPLPTFSSNTSFCPGASTTIFTTPGYPTYLWSPGGGNADSLIINTAGLYTVIVTDANGCSATNSVNVTASGVSPAITGQFTICGADSAMLTANSGVGYTYLWSTGETTPTIYTTTSGTYTVTVTSGLCTGTTSVNVIASANPLPIITGADTICQGATTSFNVNSFSSYDWSTGSILQNSNIISTAGIYTVTVTDANGCVADTSVTLVINPNPQPVIMFSATDVCIGDSITFNAGGVGWTYLWSNGLTSQIIKVGASGTYTVTVTDANGCSHDTSKTVTVHPLPTPTITGILSVCDGNSAWLDAGSYSAYQWSSTASTQIITPNTQGVYTVTVTDNNGCTGVDSVTVNVATNPVSIITGNLIICQGDSTLLTATAANCTFLWSTGSTIATTYVNSAGTYTVTATNTSNTCTHDTLVTLVVNPIPLFTLSGDTVICSGDSSNFSIAPVAGSFVWSGGQTSSSVYVNAQGTYSVTVTNNFNCSASHSLPLYVNAIPSPNVTGDTVICFGDSSALGVGAGYSTYQWSTGQTTASISVGAQQMYYVTVTNAAGCPNSDSLFVTVNPVPAPVITGDSSVCDGDTAHLDAGGGFSSYLWSLNGATTSNLNVLLSGTYYVTVSNTYGCTKQALFVVAVKPIPYPNISGPTGICDSSTALLNCTFGYSNYLWSTGSTLPSIYVANSGTYSVTVVDTNGCSNSDTYSIVSYPLPVVSITGNNSLCIGDTSTLTAAPANLIYQWSDGSTTDTIDVTTAGNYTVIVTDANGCSNTAMHFVNVFPLPTPSIAGDLEICAGDVTTLTCNSGFQQYLWSTTQTTPSIYATNAGTYAVTVTDVNGCTGTITSNLIVNPLPIVNINGPSQTCGNTPQTLNATSGYPNYLWSTGATTTSIVVIGSGIYSVMITDNMGCTNTASKPFTVFPNPLPLILGDSTFCLGQSTSLNAGAGYQSYLWSNGATTQIINVNSAGTYLVSVTDTNNCGGAAAPITINVLQASAYITPSSSQDLCIGQSVLLTANQGELYLWSTGDTTQSVNISASGIYFVEVTNQNGCSALSSTINTYVHASPYINFWADTSVDCGVGYRFQVTNNSFYEPSSTILWDFGDGYFSSEDSPLHYYYVSGTYIVKFFVVSPYGCSSVDSLTINASNHELPIARFTTDAETQFEFGKKLNFIDQSENAVWWEWEFGDGSSSDEQFPAHTYDYGGPSRFGVSLTVKNIDGCADDTVKEIQLSPFLIPNAFTPNDDLHNDLFTPTGYEFNESGGFKMQIFNRWGNLVFETNNYATKWDGTINGKKAPQGVYIYKIVATSFSGQSEKYKGTITLMR